MEPEKTRTYPSVSSNNNSSQQSSSSMSISNLVGGTLAIGQNRGVCMYIYFSYSGTVLGGPSSSSALTRVSLLIYILPHAASAPRVKPQCHLFYSKLLVFPFSNTQNSVKDQVLCVGQTSCKQGEEIYSRGCNIRYIERSWRRQRQRISVGSHHAVSCSCSCHRRAHS